MFKYFFAIFLFGIILIDWIFFPKESRRAWIAMFILFGTASVLSLFQAPVFLVADFLGVARGVDIAIYLSSVILVREVFLSRSRFVAQESALTSIVRQMAIQNVTQVSKFDVSNSSK